MSLSFWIRDYVFLPLAAARRNQWWPYVALASSMVLFGLWHAAKWTFVCWGLYHGLVLVIHRVWQQLKRRSSIETPDATVGVFVAWSTTFAAGVTRVGVVSGE